MFGGSTLLLAMWLEAPEVAMTPAEAQAIAKPAARILARSAWFVQLYTWLMKTTAKDRDLVALLIAIGAYTWRVSPLVSAKLNEKGGLNGVFTGTLAGVRERRAQADEQKAAQLNQRNARRRVSLFRQREQAQPASGSDEGGESGNAAATGEHINWPTVLGGYGALVSDALETGVVRPGSGGVRPSAS